MIIIIYKITNNINNKSYIGKTKYNSIWERYNCVRNHKDIIKHHHNKYLVRSFEKYGFDNFSFDVLEETDNIDELNELEMKYIRKYDSFKNGYNLTLGGDGKSTKIFKDKIEYIEYNFKYRIKYMNPSEMDEYYELKDNIKCYTKYYGDNHRYVDEYKESLLEFKLNIVSKYSRNGYNYELYNEIYFE